VPAEAEPRLEIEDVLEGERFGVRDQCFVAGSKLIVVGRGFVPRVPVHVGANTVRPGSAGVFSVVITADTRRAQERVTFGVVRDRWLVPWD
jgi:hypothetical protein